MTTPQPHVLIVEPNEVTRKLLAGILNQNGYATYEAVDGDTALMFLSKQPALAIFDVDGDLASVRGFLHKARQNRLRLVALSHQSDVVALKTRLQVTHLSVLAKPILPHSLLSNVETCLLKDVTAEIASTPPAEDKPGSPLRTQREGFMRRAMDLAYEKMDQNQGGPFAAVVVRHGRVIGEGWDQVIREKDPTAHAEMMALRAAARTSGDYRLEGCEMYTVAEPCPMCLGALYWARIDRVYYAMTTEDTTQLGFDVDYIYRDIAQPPHKRILPSQMLLREETQPLFGAWLKKPDKEVY